MPPRRVLLTHLVTVFALIVAFAVGVYLWRLSAPIDSCKVEREFAREGKELHYIDTTLADGRAGSTFALNPGDLIRHQLYLRTPQGQGQWIYLTPDRIVRGRKGYLGRVKTSAELLLTTFGPVLFVDDRPVLANAGPWEAFWVTTPDAGPPPQPVAIPRVRVRDTFEREELDVHPYARITGGTVHLAQHGGGMPANAAEKADFNVQRAVNPFTVHASNQGRLTYHVHAPRHWGDTHAEAAFYFGVPKTGPVVDRETMPLDTDMLVVMGPEDGVQVAFGWSGTAACFVLQTRAPDDDGWTMLAHYKDDRPPLTNWVKIGLACQQGHRVTGFLDGLPVLMLDLPVRVRGPFHIQTGTGLAEFDNVHAWSLPVLTTECVALMIRSRQFAGKRRKDKADQDDFDHWAASSDAFKTVSWRDAANATACAAIVTREAILGDFTCEPTTDGIPDNLHGITHHIALYDGHPDSTLDVREQTPRVTIRAVRHEQGWLVRKRGNGFAGLDADTSVTTLALARREVHRDRVCLQVEGLWLPISEPVRGPVHVAIIRKLNERADSPALKPPEPTPSVVRCKNLVHELFEDAPTDWNWVDGAFRMDCRWACQDQWNFMACGSIGMPYITSKRVFSGDQTHDAFLCLRATFPWDAGDTTFEYNPDIDRANKFQRLAAANGWYNRHDLNLSFCTDGRNPLSGYAVIFGGEDNTVTQLLRKGKAVAKSQTPEHLFPTAPSFMAVHWIWWRITVRKTGPRIRVYLDDKLLFDYTDPKPIEGGHLGFWSVRNGFAISRISSMAQELHVDSHRYYVADSDHDSNGIWKALVPDAVQLVQAPLTNRLEVTNTFGGGFFAVRHLPAEPVDLRKTPMLTLPLRLGSTTRVNLHLEIDGKPYIVRLGEAPLAGMKALLVPGAETGECFQLPVIPESVVRARYCLAELPADTGVVRLNLLQALRKLSGVSTNPMLTCLTIGNSSNADYLMAGYGGNAAGSSYTVEPPVFSE